MNGTTKYVDLMKSAIKPKLETLFVFILLIALAFTPNAGFEKSEDTRPHTISGMACNSEHTGACFTENYTYWKINRLLWPAKLTDSLTGEYIYADESAKAYNLPVATSAAEFPKVYLSVWLEREKVFIGEFGYVNKYASFTLHILPNTLKPIVDVAYWYFLSSLIVYAYSLRKPQVTTDLRYLHLP